MNKVMIAWFRYWGMARESHRLNLHTDPHVLEIERGLQRDFMQALRFTKVQDVN